ncbi:MAG: TrmH family RNA methyltransferase [Pirellulales bacterium]
MALYRLTDLDDPRLAPFQSLKATNATRWAERFVAEGDKLVQRLLATDFTVHSVLAGASHLSALDAETTRNLDVLVVPDAWIEGIVGFNFHRGLLACAQRKPNPDVAALCRAAGNQATLVVCPDVQNPENLGSILRLADAFGVCAVMLGGECADPLSRRVLRVSMGSALRVPVARCDDLQADLAALRSQCGVEVWATATSARESFDGTARPARLALVFGSEGHGLTPQWLEFCDRAIRVPMLGAVDSLNVAVAAGIMLYHLTRPTPGRPPQAEK